MDSSLISIAIKRTINKELVKDLESLTKWERVSPMKHE